VRGKRAGFLARKSAPALHFMQHFHHAVHRGTRECSPLNCTSGIRHRYRSRKSLRHTVRRTRKRILPAVRRTIPFRLHARQQDALAPSPNRPPNSPSARRDAGTCCVHPRSPRDSRATARRQQRLATASACTIARQPLPTSSALQVPASRAAHAESRKARVSVVRFTGRHNPIDAVPFSCRPASGELPLARPACLIFLFRRIGQRHNPARWRNLPAGIPKA